MSVKAMAQVWELDLSHNELLILLAMTDHADHEGKNIYPSMALVAWKTGYSERQVRRVVNGLVKTGILSIVEGRRGFVKKYSFDASKGQIKAEFKAEFKAEKVGQNVLPPSDIAMSYPPGQNVLPPSDIAMSYEPSIEPSVEPSEKEKELKELTFSFSSNEISSDLLQSDNEFGNEGAKVIADNDLKDATPKRERDRFFDGILLIAWGIKPEDQATNAYYQLKQKTLGARIGSIKKDLIALKAEPDDIWLFKLWYNNKYGADIAIPQDREKFVRHFSDWLNASKPIIIPPVMEVPEEKPDPEVQAKLLDAMSKFADENWR